MSNDARCADRCRCLPLQNDKRDYIVNMRSLDDRQALVDDFQAMFNAVPDDLQVRPHRRIGSRRALPCDLACTAAAATLGAHCCAAAGRRTTT